MRTMWVVEFDGARNNNFTLIRLILASTVLFAHSFALTGSGRDPISALIFPHAAIQELAVNGFFIVSGFLVTASLVKRGPLDYAWRRVARLFPAYWVCLIIFVLFVGPFITSLSTPDYFDHPIVLSQLYRGFYIFNGTQGALPGVFMDHRYPEMFNGSLWTLTAEVRCYVFLIGLGLIAAFFGRQSWSPLLVGVVVIGYFSYDNLPLFAGHQNWARLGFSFALGAIAWVNRERLPLHPILALASAVAPFAFADAAWFELVLGISMTYLILYVAFAIYHVDLDRFGDISYGVYIYAWPVQQLVMWPGQAGLTNAILSALVVTPIAIASWFLIEKPALSLLLAKRKPAPITRDPEASLAPDSRPPSVAGQR